MIPSLIKSNHNMENTYNFPPYKSNHKDVDAELYDFIDTCIKIQSHT